MITKKMTNEDIKAIESLDYVDGMHLLAYSEATGKHPAEAIIDDEYRDNSNYYRRKSISQIVDDVLSNDRDFYGACRSWEGKIPEYIIPFLDREAIETYYKENGFHDLLNCIGEVVGAVEVHEEGLAKDEAERVHWVK